MNGNINFKIVGSGPTGSLLAIALSKLKVNVYLLDLLSKKKLINKDKTYALTHSSRLILSKFDIWNKLNPYLYKFDSLSISDNVFSSISILNISDLDEEISATNSIGWVIKHNDLMNVLFAEIKKKDNIFFNSKIPSINKNSFFQYEFVSTGANSNYKKYQNYFDFKKSYNQSCLTFEVLVRGNVEKMAYEIFRKEGPLALLPLDKNRYQIIWTSSTLKAIDRLNSSQNFLLDNLSNILPNNIKLDQIVSDINIFPVSLSFKIPYFNFSKVVFVGDSLHTFHPVGGQGLNTCWRDVSAIYDILKSDLIFQKRSLRLFKHKFFLKRFLDIFITTIITDSLINVFANKNIFLFPIRKISFIFLNKISLFRKFVLNHMTKSIVFSTNK